ncbi:MAG: L-threonylcarbamoyladenylate synthase [Armatimonadota bacterium]|nr:L-threonylcarbamoyladenylate synthase [Armatimonadota bacterium]
MLILRVNPEKPDKESINVAADAIRRGDLVIFPTETVYGLAADALCETAVQKVFDAKGREERNPLPVQIPDVSELSEVARQIPEAAFALAARFWPGPLTLVLFKNKRISRLVTGGTDKIGVRIPNHPVALTLLRNVARPIVATSANLSGQPPAVTAEQAAEPLKQHVAIVLDAGRCQISVPSTVLDITVQPARILRLGAISREAIESVIGSCEFSEQ